MNELLSRLDRKAQRGSKPRCHWLTQGAAATVASRLTRLVDPWASVCANDRWMPQGFDELHEAQLNQAPRVLNPELGLRLMRWWLPEGRETARTPNFDIASTCTIDKQPGLLLIEAKAHAEELNGEAGGRRFSSDTTQDGKDAHRTIGKAVDQAREGLCAATLLQWNISRDSHYQMSNRFAWAWKLADLGVPVVLVYLGFLNATEMTDRGEPFVDRASWESLVRAHSAPLFPSEVWDRSWSVNGHPFIPLIKSIEIPLDAGLSS